MACTCGTLFAGYVKACRRCWLVGHVSGSHKLDRWRLAELRTLAANLAIACMLDRAWSLGYAAAGDAYGMADGTEWYPGTGRPAP